MVFLENTSNNVPNNQFINNSVTRDEIPNVQSNYNPEIFKNPVRGGPKMLGELKKCFSEIRGNQAKAMKIMGNIVLVLAVTAVLTKLLTTRCASDADSDALEMFPGVSVNCIPFVPNVGRVIIDVDLNSSSHCYSSKSCVELGDSLRKQQGKFRYNFILGTYGFVYSILGYNCASEEWEEALYIRLPVESIYHGQDFMAARNAVSKLHEVLREGLECGKLRTNSTVVASGCGAHNQWCTRALQELVTDGSVDGTAPTRTSHFDSAQPGHNFNPLSLSRVYSYQYKLVVCDEHHG